MKLTTHPASAQSWGQSRETWPDILWSSIKIVNDVIMGVSVLANYNAQMSGEFREIRVYKGLISHSKTWVGTYCGCELFQLLLEYKFLEIGFRNKTLCLWAIYIKPIQRLSHWAFMCSSLNLFDQEFLNRLSPVQGF